MSEFEKRLKQLFCREMNEHELVELDDASIALLDAKAFSSWRELKSKFDTHEVASSTWIKTCTAGYVTEVSFHSDGLLTEHTLFDRLKTQGSWSIKDGQLLVTIQKRENTYRFFVIKSAKDNIHSAVEYKNDELHSYLKLAPIRD